MSLSHDAAVSTMGCSSSNSATEEARVEAPVAELNWKAVHSAIRWNKPIVEISALMNSAEAVNCADEQNGNRPIHIAAQNGHFPIVKLLVEKKVELDAKNGKGNTGIHMAVGYDYFDCAKLLVEAGADPMALNDEGYPGNRGLEGNKTYGIAALMSATSPEEVMVGFALCEDQIEDLKAAKANFVSAGLKAKSTIGKELWTSDMQDKLKAITLSI